MRMRSMYAIVPFMDLLEPIVLSKTHNNKHLIFVGTYPRRPAWRGLLLYAGSAVENAGAFLKVLDYIL